MRHIFILLALLCLLGAIYADNTWHSYKVIYLSFQLLLNDLTQLD